MFRIVAMGSADDNSLWRGNPARAALADWAIKYVSKLALTAPKIMSSCNTMKIAMVLVVVMARMGGMV